jgi:hypothetical protein
MHLEFIATNRCHRCGQIFAAQLVPPSLRDKEDSNTMSIVVVRPT